MYAVDAAFSEARWVEKCSMLIGSGTTAWALILRPRGFVCHSPQIRKQILAVAGRDLSVARRNLAELTRYVDMHAAHLATCTGSADDRIPLMAAETYPRLPGGIGASLQEVQKN